MYKIEYYPDTALSVAASSYFQVPIKGTESELVDALEICIEYPNLLILEDGLGRVVKLVPMRRVKAITRIEESEPQE
jgi:hypothetical protein